MLPKNKKGNTMSKNSQYVRKYRKQMKQKAILYKGGACKICLYNKYHGALEFHHLEPLEKDFAISGNGACRSWQKIQEELDKCVLLCSNCHKEVHAGLTQLVE